MGVLDYVAKLRVFGNNTRGKNVSKGSKRRPENSKKFRANYERAFGGSETLKAIKSLKNYTQRRNNNGR